MRFASQFACLVSLTTTMIAGAVQPALATYMCAVQDSPDGFVALRAKPSEDGDVIAKAATGDAVVIQQSDNSDLIEDGDWVSVYHDPGDVAPDKSDPDYAKRHVGWMRRQFVNDCG